MPDLTLISRPVVLSAGTSAATLTAILANLAGITGRMSLYGLTDTLEAKLMASTSTEALFPENYYRQGFVAGTTPASIPGWSLVRASTGYAMTLAGALTPFASGVARIVDRGLLIESARTNLFLRSQELDNASWVKTAMTISANVTAAPDGTTTADKMTPNAGTADHEVYQALSVTGDARYTFSRFFKEAGKRYVTVLGTGAHFGSQDYATYDLQTGSVTQTGTNGTASIEAYGNGWFRVVRTLVAEDTGSGAWFITCGDSPTPGRTTASTGNGSDGVYAWGAQMEVAANASSYIPTTSASATRAADVVTTPFFAAVDGDFSVLATVEFTRLADGQSEQTLIEVDNSITDDRVMIGRAETGAAYSSAVLGGVYASLGTVAKNGARVMKAAILRRGLTYEFYADGVLIGSEALASAPALNALRIGALSDGTSMLKDYLRKIVILPFAMDEAAAIEATT